jgi:PIN domain nuclease of toxin-antitoxin system
MRLLLDTHVLLWAMTSPHQLSVSLEAAIKTAENDVAVSAVSVWEITIKRMLGKLDIDIHELIKTIGDAGFTELPVRFTQSLNLEVLPPHHRDPFDRMLIAQSIADGRRLVTFDEKILKYAGVLGFAPLSA